MDEKEWENILDILKQAKTAVNKGDSFKLKELSNRTIHSASLYKDKENILVAVIIYSLSKIIERSKTSEYKGLNNFIKNYLKCIGKALNALEKKDLKKFEESLEFIREEINVLDKDLKNYIKEVFRKASINKASRIYEHGISMEQTARILGITIWELAEYAGQTNISNEMTKTIPVKERIKFAMGLFK